MNSCKSEKVIDSLDNLYYSEKNLRKTDSNYPESFCDNLVYELRQLDSSLDELFLIPNNELNTHVSIHKFRLKVSRRISSFSSILKSLSRQCESLSNSQQRVKLFTLFQFYNERLMRHKNRLSEWWSKNERRYHTLYLSSFVSQMNSSDRLYYLMVFSPNYPSRTKDNYEFPDTNDNSYTNNIKEDVQTGGDEFITKKLRDTRNMMISQLNQMDAAESSLLMSSNYISQQEAVLKVLRGKFSSARLTFNLVKRRALKRYGLVRTCYFFFISSCCFIVLRRLRFFKIFKLSLKLVTVPYKYLSKRRTVPSVELKPSEF